MAKVNQQNLKVSTAEVANLFKQADHAQLTKFSLKKVSSHSFQS